MKLNKHWTLGLILLGTGLLGAQSNTSGAPASLAVTEIDTIDFVLSDGEGRSLYLFLEDRPGESTCTEGCAEAWPPLLTNGEVEAAEGVNEDLIGTTERPDGTQQVTFNGWPLYYYAEDEDVGDFNGQGVGDVWYLLTDQGEPAGAPAGAAEAAQQAGESAEQAGGSTDGAQTGNAGTAEGSQAQSSADVTVALGEHAEGAEGFLVDGEGRTLYVFTEDQQGTSTCTEECARAWPPLLTTTGKVIGMGGVAPGFLGTTEREDGSLQVTYMGRPLYYFAQDQQPGDINGQAAGDAWYLASLMGEPITDVSVLEAVEEVEEEEAPPVSQAVLQVGGQVYSQNCVGCHGSNGEGGVGVVLAENQGLNTANVVGTILTGRNEMPAFASRLTDEEIASVATYIRNNWGNELGPVSVQEVQQQK